MDDIVTQLYSSPASFATVQPFESVNTAPKLQSRYADSISSLGKKPHCLLACTGSVATVQIPELAVRLSQYFEVLIVCTKRAIFFLMRSEEYNPSIWQQFWGNGFSS
jgi:hypothetical protein